MQWPTSFSYDWGLDLPESLLPFRKRSRPLFLPVIQALETVLEAVHEHAEGQVALKLCPGTYWLRLASRRPGNGVPIHGTHAVAGLKPAVVDLSEKQGSHLRMESRGRGSVCPRLSARPEPSSKTRHGCDLLHAFFDPEYGDL